ncbi:MAG: hypothetical protein ACJ8EL_06325 [Rhizomicrobium sp.]
MGVAVLPIGATGSAAQTLASNAIADPDKFTPELDATGRTGLAPLASHTDNLKSLKPPILELIRKLQGKV